MFFFIAVLLAIAGVIAAIVAWRGEGSMIAIHETETLSVAEVVALHHAGRLGHAVEVMGTIECDTPPLRAPYSEALCVAYSYTVSEDQERQGYTTHGYGANQQMSLVSQRGQQNIGHSLDHQDNYVPRFYVRDSTGRIAVDPAGASLDMPETVARYESYTSADLDVERQIWREEHALPLGNRAYILAYVANDHGEPVLMRHPVDNTRRFIISHRDEQALLAHTRWRAYGLYLFSGISMGVALLLIAFALHVF